MIFSKEEIVERIEYFKDRAEKDKDFCEEQYKGLTLRCLAACYHYYELSTIILDDLSYDICEANWYCMGRALGHLKEDETKPCIGFDYNHPLADEAIKLAESLPPKRGK